MEAILERKKVISVAPGRTCLFGDHQDYLGLPVIACAIDRNIKLTAVENDSRVFKIKLLDLNTERIIKIDETFDILAPRDYFASSLRVLKRYGCFPTCGYDIEITGNIPINAGASSSSALIGAWVNFLLQSFGAERAITSEFIAQVAYESEVVEHGEPGGMMDQYSVAMGNIVHINTGENFSCNVIGHQLDGLVIGESGVPKETIGLLSKLKRNALVAIEIIKQNVKGFDLHTADIADLKKYTNYLPDRYVPYFEAAIKNHSITQEAIKEFNNKTIDVSKLGCLMNEHHKELRDNLEITVSKIDDMIQAALNAGALGAKIVGSGGGGSIVVLAPGKEAEVIDGLLAVGAKDAYRVAVDTGVKTL